MLFLGISDRSQLISTAYHSLMASLSTRTWTGNLTVSGHSVRVALSCHFRDRAIWFVTHADSDAAPIMKDTNLEIICVQTFEFPFVLSGKTLKGQL